MRARGNPTTTFLAALAVLALALVGLEAGTRIGFRRVSGLEGRTAAEYAAATALRREPGRRHVLLVGNSLLLAGVDMDGLRAALPADTASSRFVIEDTGFLDWRFGIRRLLAEGSDPDRLVLVLGAEQFAPRTIRGDYDAYYLFRRADLPEIGRALGYSLTQVTGLYFANLSLFYAGRNNVRNFVLGRVAPAYRDFRRSLEFDTRRERRGTVDREALVEGLADLGARCAARGVRLLVVVAPGFSSAYADYLAAAAAAARVELVAPLAAGALPRADFSDGFHLNETGARAFTAALARELTAR